MAYKVGEVVCDKLKTGWPSSWPKFAVPDDPPWDDRI
jgi:hypothetical protein